MAIAAVPAYLGKNFSQASPGLRFGMYLALWGVESRTGEALWTTHDVNYRSTGQQREERPSKDINKAAALRNALKLNQADMVAMAALVRRQSALAAPLAAQGQLLTLQALAVAPFTTGLGNEHPLENGFAFLNPYGLPYLAGSGVKGVLRQAASELKGGDWGDSCGWNEPALTALFGKAGSDHDSDSDSDGDSDSDSDSDSDFQRGALMFWDVIPQVNGDALQVEVMTPHQTHYHQNNVSPHESGQPNPINFLTVPPGSGFAFHVQCDLPFLNLLAPELAQDGRWQRLVSAALAHAFQWLGFGAKTAVGYGAMVEDIAARQQREQQAAAQRAATAAQDRALRLAALSPEQREAEEATVALAAFSTLLETEKQLKRYKPGSVFDDQRNTYLHAALALQGAAARAEAARALRESYQFTGWPGNKSRKQEVKKWLTELDGQT